ncbi:MAG: hypothetical protein GQ554_06375 [Deltaproteobacteria bacterium]|nr:hypothetical protein [Deltaproteobacteria bacterium]
MPGIILSASFIITSAFLGVMLVWCCVCGAVVGPGTLTADASPQGLAGSALG